MLEYGFNELDNDFVTLWSKKIIGGETSLVFEDLTKLAELGQINAIQNWYLIAKAGDDNFQIDSIVEKLDNSGANEMLARAHKDFFKNDRQTTIDEWDRLNKKALIDSDYELDKKMIASGRKIRTSVYGNYFKYAIEAYYSDYKSTLNTLMLERFYEMMAGRLPIHKSWIDIDYRASNWGFRKLRKKLLKAYEQDKDNVAVAFALGKNLTLFRADDKLKALGNKILTELSNRELSKTLQDYDIKGTKGLIKQQIDGKGKTTSIKPETTDAEIMQAQESISHFDTKLGL